MVGELNGPQALDLYGRRRSPAARNPLTWIAGVVATTAAVALAAVLVVVFAATIAVVLVLSAAVLAAVAAAWRLGRGRGGRERLDAMAGGSSALAPGIPQRLGGRVGHSWVAYGWDRQA